MTPGEALAAAFCCFLIGWLSWFVGYMVDPKKRRFWLWGVGLNSLMMVVVILLALLH